MGEKKDLTRIEDLSEFIHELDSSADEDINTSPEESSSEDLKQSSPDFSSTPSFEQPQENQPISEGQEDSFEQPQENQPISEGQETSFEQPQENQPISEGQEASFEQIEDNQPISEGQEDSFEQLEENQPISEGQEASFEQPQENTFEDSQSESLNQSVDDSSSMETMESNVFQETGKNEKAHTPVSDMLEEIKDFAESLTYRSAGTGGNPPFSMILTHISKENIEDIKNILREHELVNKNNQSDIEESLSRGSVIISQISEYAAIYLAHRMKRFDLKIKIGLSDQLHPSQSYGHDARGSISRKNMEQNKMESQDLERKDRIIITTTETLEGYKIHHYLDVITEHSIVDKDEFEAFNEQSRLYGDLIERLKAKAAMTSGNAVIGIKWRFDPISIDPGSSERYKVVCSGNVVLVEQKKTISGRTVPASREDLRHS